MADVESLRMLLFVPLQPAVHHVQRASAEIRVTVGQYFLLSCFAWSARAENIYQDTEQRTSTPAFSNDPVYNVCVRFLEC